MAQESFAHRFADLLRSVDPDAEFLDLTTMWLPCKDRATQLEHLFTFGRPAHLPAHPLYPAAEYDDDRPPAKIAKWSIPITMLFAALDGELPLPFGAPLSLIPWSIDPQPAERTDRPDPTPLPWRTHMVRFKEARDAEEGRIVAREQPPEAIFHETRGKRPHYREARELIPNVMLYPRSWDWGIAGCLGLILLVEDRRGRAISVEHHGDQLVVVTESAVGDGPASVRWMANTGFDLTQDLSNPHRWSGELGRSGTQGKLTIAVEGGGVCEVARLDLRAVKPAKAACDALPPSRLTVSVPFSERVNDLDGDWKSALIGVVADANPAAEVVGGRVSQTRGRAILSIVLPAGLSEDAAKAEAARIGTACDDFIRSARRQRGRDAMRALAPEVPGRLPVPTDEMSPTEKGDLLMRYVAAEAPVGGLDFSMAAVPPGTNLRGAKLARVILRQAVLQGVDLTGADLRGATLLHARANGATLEGALLHEADVRHADLRRTDLRRAELHRARANDCDLRDCDLRDCDLRDANLSGATATGARTDGAVVTGVFVDVRTYEHSGWTTSDCVALQQRGVKFVSLDEFPDTIRTALEGEASGITIAFDVRMHRFDGTAFEALIEEVLGAESDVGIEEKSRPDASLGFIRINGSRATDLVQVVEAFYDRVWTAHGTAEGHAIAERLSAIEGHLDKLRNHVVEVKANTTLLADPDVREMLTDKGAEHVDAKNTAAITTRFQRIGAGLAGELKKRTLGIVLGDDVADLAIEEGGSVLAEAHEVLKGNMNPFERKLLGMEVEDERRKE